VGKSNILLRFTNKCFHNEHDLTIGVEIGVEIATKLVSRQGKKYRLQFWDTAGQEAFRAITTSYYRGTIGCLVVYNVTDRTSFDSLSYWVNDIKKYCDPSIVTALVGNKIDLKEQREVSTEEGQEFADKHNMLFFETSAKTGNGVDAKTGNGVDIDTCIFKIVDTIGSKIESNKINLSTNTGCIKITQPSTKLTETQAGTGSGNGSGGWGCSC